MTQSAAAGGWTIGQISQSDNRSRWILGATSCVLGLVVLDETVVGVALPTIRQELGVSELASHWVVNAYLLAFTCFVAVGGRVVDMLERRSVFAAGAGVFALGSLIAGIAPSGGILIAARAIQGVGAAITFPCSFAILTAAFPVERRGAAFAIQTMIAGAFMASGPLVGGLFSQTLSWRWIFLINLPVIAAITVILFTALRPTEAEPSAETNAGSFHPAAFDYAGLVALVVGLSTLIFALMQSSDWGWSTPVTILPLLAGTVAMIAFVFIEQRRSAPLINLNFLQIPTFTGGTLIFAVFQFEKMAVFIFAALFVQHELGHTPIQAGLTITIAILPTLITSRIAGKLRDTLGPRIPVIAALLVTALTILLMAVATVIESYMLMTVMLIIWGAVMPGIAVPLRPSVLGAVAEKSRGQASGINLSIQMLGGTVGIALCSVLMAATSTYWTVFAFAGFASLLAAFICWAMVERQTEVRA